MTNKTYKRQFNKIKNRIRNGHGKPGDINRLKYLKEKLRYIN